jgi:hypothetical protein
MNDDDRSSPPIPVPHLRRAVSALRLVFWGALICLIDLHINGVDLIHDVAGTVLVALGAWSLSGLRVDETYRTWMRFAAVVAVLSVAAAALEHVPRSGPARAFVEGVGLLEVAALCVGCAMMMRLARAAGLPDVAAHWNVTLRWFLGVYAGLLGLFRGAAALWILAGRPRLPLPGVHPSAWIAGVLLLLGLLLWPWLRFFGSTNRLSDALRLKAWTRARRERRVRSSSRDGAP